MSVISINRKDRFKDFLNIIFFIASVLCGALLINAFVFRSYNIVGASMEDTLYDGERIIVNRIPVTISYIKNETYVPKRGKIIVFENPKQDLKKQDKYIIKRVIGLPGDRVVVHNGKMTLYINNSKKGIDPNTMIDDKPRSPISGEIDTVVGDKEIFVVGDHRDGNHSWDSRSGPEGLGNIPLHDVIGPVSIRLFPISKFRFF